VRQWRKNGIAIDDAELGDLAASDCEAVCELDGVRLRFTAETITARFWQCAVAQGAALVLTLRQIDSPRGADPIHLVELSGAAPLASRSCEGRQCGQLADALAIADRTARRYVCGELFRKARELIAGHRAA
jgi:hypothetical protein